MKLVVTYTVTDGCSYSSDHVVPVEFESPEALLVAFDEAIRHWRKNSPSGIFQIGRKSFDVYSFIRDDPVGHTLPNVYTLEEWFNSYSKS